MQLMEQNNEDSILAFAEQPITWATRVTDMCSAWVPCQIIGGIGYDSFARYRTNLMEATAWLSSLAVVFLIAPIFSTSSGSDVVIDTHWSRGEADKNVWVYVGLSHIVVKKGDDHMDIAWEDEDCPDSYCNDCKHACLSAMSVVIIAFVLSALQMATDLNRSVTQRDTNFKKCLAICFGLGATICTLSSISTLTHQCFHELPSSVDYPKKDMYDLEVEWSYGPGFFCTLAAGVLQLVNVVFHILTPTPKPSPEHADLTLDNSPEEPLVHS